MIGFRSSRRLPLLAGALILTPLLTIGCGSSHKPATVAGKVTIDGQPANSGNVIFTTADGQNVSAAIQPDGAFQAIGVPPGNAKVSVAPLPKLPVAPTTKGMENMPGMAVVKPIPIPKKYARADSSGLATNLKEGPNEYNVELTTR